MPWQPYMTIREVKKMSKIWAKYILSFIFRSITPSTPLFHFIDAIFIIFSNGFIIISSPIFVFIIFIDIVCIVVKWFFEDGSGEDEIMPTLAGDEGWRCIILHHVGRWEGVCGGGEVKWRYGVVEGEDSSNNTKQNYSWMWMLVLENFKVFQIFNLKAENNLKCSSF